MEKMTKKDRIKKFAKDHGKKTAVITGLFALTGIGLVAFEKKQQARTEWVKEENEWLDSLHAEGKTAFYLHDLTYAVVPADTPSEWVQRPFKP